MSAGHQGLVGQRPISTPGRVKRLYVVQKYSPINLYGHRHDRVLPPIATMLAPPALLQVPRSGRRKHHIFDGGLVSAFLLTTELKH